jgi:hypothetical protein
MIFFPDAFSSLFARMWTQSGRLCLQPIVRVAPLAAT